MRVDGFSKIIANVLPSSGLRAFAPAFRLFFIATLASRIARKLFCGHFDQIEEMSRRLIHHTASVAARQR